MSRRLIESAGLMPIHDKVMAGERLTYDDGLALYTHPNLNALGALANLVRERMNGNVTYYVRNQHINYTNVCNKGCKFCAFYAQKGGPDPYTMSIEEVQNRLRMHLDVPIKEVHMVAGINPKLPYSYYLDLLRAVKAIRPGVHIKAFTCVEIAEIWRQANKPLDEVFADLREAGLDSLPGGGIEILSDRVHMELFGRKLSGDQWMEISKAAAKAGLTQYATMLYGHIETVPERVEHLVKMRALQDETGHFVTFTPLSFHPEGTQLADLPHPTGDGDLRALAVSRLMLDNFQHIKTFWIMNTPQVSQLAQWYGADDLDGTIHEYEITYQDGDQGNKKQVLTRRQLIGLIEEAGRTPIERDSFYNQVHADDELDDPVRRSNPQSAAIPLAMAR
ncbi:MAG: CofH family radical SAM protein [Armatimonadetes bacterium]|nr:CofH family radical SAM protein [Armatimonadota bacterium]